MKKYKFTGKKLTLEQSKAIEQVLFDYHWNLIFGENDKTLKNDYLENLGDVFPELKESAIKTVNEWKIKQKEPKPISESEQAKMDLGFDW